MYTQVIPVTLGAHGASAGPSTTSYSTIVYQALYPAGSPEQTTVAGGTAPKSTQYITSSFTATFAAPTDLSSGAPLSGHFPATMWAGPSAPPSWLSLMFHPRPTGPPGVQASPDQSSASANSIATAISSAYAAPGILSGGGSSPSATEGASVSMTTMSNGVVAPIPTMPPTNTISTQYVPAAGNIASISSSSTVTGATKITATVRVPAMYTGAANKVGAGLTGVAFVVAGLLAL
ncbi:hypothetical protein B0A49_01436 [Cryomyces minteri]|uniref:Uncharacterized protein n=1 Tax=Cryomyces minteri TaxID=331657 RepID=A0A4U0XUR6_9PEZI|nr:hypothetical protein B0A49_01436 [Cryomyces minteri]